MTDLIERLRTAALVDARFADLCGEAADALEPALREAQKVPHLEAMRPNWAKGYSSDSIAAQCSANALSSLWELLGAKDQTEAAEKLRQALRDTAVGSALRELCGHVAGATDEIVTVFEDDATRTWHVKLKGSKRDFYAHSLDAVMALTAKECRK